MVSVNGVDLEGLPCKEVINLLTSAEEPITLVVRRHTQSPDSGPSTLQGGGREGGRGGEEGGGEEGGGRGRENAGSTMANYSPASIAHAQLNGLKVVQVCKGPTGIGIIVSGSDTTPYAPIAVMDVIHLGPADRTGRISPGDIILKVNALSFESIALGEAQSILKGLPQGVVKLLLKGREATTPMENTAR